jgi:hypothetical protein
LTKADSLPYTTGVSNSMNKAENVMVLNVIQGPFNPELDPDIWSLLCTVQTQDGKASVEEVRSSAFSYLYTLKTDVETYGPQQIEMEWIDDK